MGFNIGRFIGSIAPAIGTAIGGAFGGQAGAAFGGAAGGALGTAFTDEPAAAATIGRTTQPGPVSTTGPNLQFQGGGTFGLPSSVGPTISAALRLPGSIGRGIPLIPFFNGGGNGNGKSKIQQILAKARAATGGPVTRNKIIDAAKVCGLETAASTFGLSVTEVCLVVVKGRTRRRRGVSAADIRRTKRTINFASKVRKDLKALAR